MSSNTLVVNALAVSVCIGAGVFFAAAPSFDTSSARQVSEQDGEASAAKYRLLVFEQRGCGACVAFNRDVRDHYLQSNYNNLAPLTPVDIHSRRSKSFNLKTQVVSTPTFVIVDNANNEVSRFRGYPGSRDRFYTMLDRIW